MHADITQENNLTVQMMCE